MRIRFCSEILKVIKTTPARKLVFVIIATIILNYPLQIIIANMVSVTGSPARKDVTNGRAYLRGYEFAPLVTLP